MLWLHFLWPRLYAFAVGPGAHFVPEHFRFCGILLEVTSVIDVVKLLHPILSPTTSLNAHWDQSTVANQVNPYSPPEVDVPHPSWWSRIKSVFSWGPLVKQSDFNRGDAVICGGIAFFIDPNDRQTLYAGSPSTDRSDERFALVAREAIRYLPDFLALHGDSPPELDDRRLVVRIVNDYTGIYSDYVRAVEVVPAPLTRSLKTVTTKNGG